MTASADRLRAAHEAYERRQNVIRSGDTDRGFAVLDEGMLPVLAGTMKPDVAGNLHCQLMSICHDLADVPRARAWTAGPGGGVPPS